MITMKMMMSTRSTSIRGTMFGSDIEPLFPPTAIPMKNSLNAPAASPSRRLRLVAAEEALRSFDSSRSARPRLSTPAERTSSTAFTTSPYFARASDRTNTVLSRRLEIWSFTAVVISESWIFLLPR